jgi:hypothetical protein
MPMVFLAGIPSRTPNSLSALMLTSYGALHRMLFIQHLQSLYGGSPNVSMFKGGGTAQMGSYLDMPDNSSSGDVRLLRTTNDFPLVPPGNPSTSPLPPCILASARPVERNPPHYLSLTLVLWPGRQLWNSPDGESCCGIAYYPG